MLILVAAALAHVPFPRGTTTITEVHVGPAAEGGQWFEVRNDTTSGQNLVEQVFTDADGDTFEVSLTVIVRAGEHAVFASEDSTVDADYRFPAAFDLRAEAGAVYHTDLLGTVDEVVWDATWGVAGGWQLHVGVAANEWANDLPGNWCAAAGTPGADNVACPGADTDDDGDGFTEEAGDCDDRDAAVHPGAPDGPAVPDDGDCDGARDDEAAVDTGEPGDTGADTGPGDTAPDDTGADSAPDTAPDDTAVDTGSPGGADPDPFVPRVSDEPTRRCGCAASGAAAAPLALLPYALRRRARRRA